MILILLLFIVGVSSQLELYDIILSDQMTGKPKQIGEPIDMFKVKVLYIIPSDKQPRDQIDYLMRQILQYVMEFFYDHLGVTIEYSYPLYDIVFSNRTEKDIFNGTYASQRYFKEDGTIDDGRNTIQHMIDIIENNYAKERYVNNYLFLGITEADIWAALGGSGFAHTGGVALNRYEALLSQALLLPWIHEIAHGLGLGHINKTLSCLSAIGIEHEYEYNFMTGGVPIYRLEYHMSNYQISLLLQMENEECLTALQGRPHPSNYLQNHNPCINSVDLNGDGLVNIDDLVVVLVTWNCYSERMECKADVNCDDKVNLDDLVNLIINYKSS